MKPCLFALETCHVTNALGKRAGLKMGLCQPETVEQQSDKTCRKKFYTADRFYKTTTIQFLGYSGLKVREEMKKCVQIKCDLGSVNVSD